ncbi:MAG: hypothetical protein DRZ80_04235 [Thermoprotei archaeon]|nr:MAG: hypothetical protein DRZ80_04235 [Thermoprotei archaeon]
MEITFFLLDGCRPDKLKEANTPNIDRLIEEGIVSLECKTVYPSLTAVGHMSILTGCHPEKTGIISHFYWDFGEKRFYEIFSDEYCQSKTIFEILRDAGLSGGVYGAYFRRGAKDKFTKKLLRKTAGFVADHMHFVMNFLVKHPSLYKMLRTQVVGAYDEFIRDFKERKHSFYYVMFNDIDKSGHKYGSDSKEYLETIEKIDEKIGDFLTLLDNMDRDVAVVIAADHGHIPVHKKIGLEAMDLSEAGYEIEDVQYVSAAALVHYESSKGDFIHAAIVSRHVQLWFDNKKDVAVILEVLKNRKEFADVRAKDDLEEFRLVNERTGDITIALSDNYGFKFLPIGEKGDHGGLTREEMNVPLIIWGDKIKGRVVENCHVVDITPTILKLLGVKYKALQGSSLVNE